MKDFWIRVFSLAAVVLILAGYNQVLKDRSKNEEIARLDEKIAQLEAAVQNKNDSMAGHNVLGGQTDAGSQLYADGEWEGSAQGFGGMIDVSVTVEEGSITNVSILSADGEDGAYLSMAEDIISKILDAQSADVDTVSGATFSSTGIKNAVTEALEQAEASGAE